MSRRIRVLHVGEGPPPGSLTGQSPGVSSIDVVRATTADEGLERLAEEDVDCVVAAEDVPGGSNLDLFEAVRDRHSDLPFVLQDGSESNLAVRVEAAVEGQRGPLTGELYETAVETATDGIAVVGENREFVMANGAFAEAVGRPREDLRGNSATDLARLDHVVDAPTDLDERYEAAAEEARRGGRGEFRYETTLQTFGSRRVVDNHVTATCRGDGSVVYVLVSRDVTERERRGRERQRENERLEEFARMASHDLRNPLNVAAARLELARDDCESEHHDHVADALERMEILIDDTLRMAQSGRTVTDREPVAIGAVVQPCWRAVATGGADLEVVDDVTIRADPTRLRQVFENLFRNAVEHGSTSPPSQTHEDAVEHGSTTSPDEGRVTVRVGSIDDSGFYVEDDGPGVPPDARTEIFEPGYSTAEDGTGYGLAIVEEIVEAHGWHIEVTEGGAGGARFEITGVDFVD